MSLCAAQDYRYMARALQLAQRGLYTTDPNPRVGCVLVKNGAIVGEGWHQRTGEAHAERHALHAAGATAQDSTAYVTLEPCCHHGRTPPCSEALLAAGVKRVVVAMRDPNPQVAGQGLAQLQTAGLEVVCGVLEDQARRLNPGFIRRMSQGRPWARVKLAMSLDGRTAMASGESQWITGPAALQDVQHLRARSAAIATSVATVLADDPSLNVRLDTAEVQQPLRVILDTQLRTPASAKTLQLGGDVLILTARQDRHRWGELQAAGAEIVCLPESDHQHLDLTAVMAELARRELNEIHIECGARLAGALLQQGLLDELVLYTAPLIMGDGAQGLFHLPELLKLADAIPLALYDKRPIGRDWRITARPEFRRVSS